MNVTKTLTVYNPGIKDKQTLINEFVVRGKIFDIIFDDIKSSNTSYPEQHYLIIGQRGSGKTTLLHRLKYAIEDSNEIKEWLVPVVLTEEQYSVNNLNDLWEEIIYYLEDHFNWKIEHKKDDEETLKNIISQLKSENRKLLLLIDNVNDLFKKLSEIELKKLRNILMTNSNIRLIGASTTYFDGVYDYSQPFFEFFKIIRLDGLDLNEIRELLKRLGELYYSKETIGKILKNNPERIEILKRLTGGIPRTIALLFQIFIDNNTGQSIKDLQMLLDAVTPLYKAKMDDLSAQQQKIVDAVAKNWDPVTTKELVVKTKLESKIISSQLRQLEKDQIIEKIEQENTKNHLYRIQERFLNIWYLMRYGRRSDQSRVIWLVRFLETWCDKIELEKRIADHIDNLKKGAFDYNSASIMGEAYVSCKKINTDLKYDLISITKSVLPALSNDLKITDSELLETATNAIKKKQYNKVIEVVEQIQNKDFYPTVVLGHAYVGLGKFEEGLKLWVTASKLKVHKDLLFNIGNVYEFELKNYERAKEFYLKSEKEGNYKAAHRLGHVMVNFYNNSTQAIKHFKLAIENGQDKAIVCLGRYYVSLNKLQKAEETFKQGIKKKIASCYDGLAVVFALKNNMTKAEEYFIRASELGNKDSMVTLAKFYLKSKKDTDKANAIDILTKAAAHKNIEAYYYLGKTLSSIEGKEKEALKYLEKAAKNGHPEAAHNLGHYYDRKDNFHKSEIYFKMAIDNGSEESVLCLSYLYLINVRNKKQTLELIKGSYDFLYKGNKYTNVLYASVLLWNNDFVEAMEKFEMFLSNSKEIKDEKQAYNETLFFLLLLIAKKQYKYALRLFNNKQFDLIDKFKPIYYALTLLLKKELPNESLKISSEIKQTVDEILVKINAFNKIYN